MARRADYTGPVSPYAGRATEKLATADAKVREANAEEREAEVRAEAADRRAERLEAALERIGKRLEAIERRLERRVAPEQKPKVKAWVGAAVVSDRDHLHGWQAIADHLGLGKSAVRHIHAHDKLPVYRLGRTMASSAAALDRWRQQRLARVEAEAEAAAGTKP